MASDGPNDCELETRLLFIITDILIKPISAMAAGKDVPHSIPPYFLMSKSYEELGLRHYCEYVI